MKDKIEDENKASEEVEIVEGIVRLKYAKGIL